MVTAKSNNTAVSTLANFFIVFVLGVSNNYFPAGGKAGIFKAEGIKSSRQVRYHYF